MKTCSSSTLLLLLISFLFISCTDDADDFVNPGPVITLNGISDGDSFQEGTTLNFTATLEDEDGIDYVEVTITGGAIPFSRREDDFPPNDDGIYSFTYELQIPQGYAGDYEVEILAEDLQGNQSSRSLNITITQ